MARPPSPPPEFDTARACTLAAEGATLRRITEILGISPKALAARIAKDEWFRESFSSARAAGLELLADDLVDISETCDDILRARLKSENLRWLLARRIPHQYGDRIAVDMTQQIDLNAALRDAAKRVPITINQAPTIALDDNQALALAALLD